MTNAIYDHKLDVIRVETLINELFIIYNSNPDYGFCSLDVVSMFDNLSMPVHMKEFVMSEINFFHKPSKKKHIEVVS